MMSVQSVVDSVRGAGIPADHIESFDGIASVVAAEAKPGDVVIVMSSGAFGGVHERILEALGGV